VPFTQTSTKSITARANVEPTADLKIQLDIKKDETDSYQEIFRYDDMANGYTSLNPNRNGSYKVSTIAIKTAFRSDNDDVVSSVFKAFEQNLDVVKTRFQRITGNEYDTTGQDVAIPAFIGTYLDKDISKMSLSPFVKTPLPNWRLDYTGLSKLGNLKDVFQSVTISHAYTASYSVMNYSNSLQYAGIDTIGINIPIEKYNDGYYSTVNAQGQIVPIYVISQVMISEQFAPLIGINVRTKGRLTARAEYKTKRDLALNITNAQVTEVSNKDVSVEMGYTKNNLKLPFKSQGRTIVLKNDVTFRLNFTVSDQKTIQRKIEELNTLTNGNVNYQLRPNLSYVVNQKLNVQMYYEWTKNTPQVSNSFPRSTNRFGFQVRFSLAQ
jgi:cell surface protein SprA